MMMNTPTAAKMRITAVVLDGSRIATMGAALPTTQAMAVTVCYTRKSILPRDKLTPVQVKDIMAASVAYFDRGFVVLLEGMSFT